MIEVGSTIYIAGKMRGIKCYNFPQFFYWQVVLEQSGYVVMNPAEKDCIRWIEDGWIFTEDQYEEVMAYDLKLIEDEADAVFVLKGWEDSEGAKREIEHAEDLGIPVFYEDKQV